MLLAICGCGHTPALESEEAAVAADALYTAITSRRSELLNSVEAELKQLHSTGKLSADAMDVLNRIVEKAKSGSWQNAAEDLDEFIRDQPVDTTPGK